MSEPVFKLLRCDAEASHMLGWAKKQVKRIVEHAKLDSFQRTWSLGDVTVRASYFGGVARLWLEAAGTERMAVWATLPNPVPYRKAVTGMGFGGRPTLTVVGSTSTPEAWGTRIEQTYEIRDSFGALVRQWTGVQRPTYDGGGKKNLVFEEWYMPYPSGLYIWPYGMQMSVINFYTNEVWFQLSHTLIEDTTVTWYAQPTAPAYSEIAATGSAEQFYVCASDGEVLGSSPADVHTVGSGSSAVTTTEYVNSTYGGNAWCVPAFLQRVYGDGSPAETELHHFVTIKTPEDVVDLSLTGASPPPSYPGTDGQEELFSETWVAARDAAVIRREEWFRTTSDSVVGGLRTGAPLAHSWDYSIKALAPYSAHVFRKAPMMAGYVDTLISSDGDGNAVRQREATLSYTAMVDDEPVTRQVVIVGTRVDTARNHYHPITGVLYGTSRTESYSQWYVPPYQVGPPLNEIEEWIPHAFLSDASVDHNPSGIATGMGLFWSGDMSSTFGWSYYHPSSEFIGDGFYSVAVSPAWFTTVPPIPAYINTLRAEAPDFVREYHVYSIPQYRKDSTATAADREWLAAALVSASTVSIIPVSYVRGDIELGMFPSPLDATGATHVDVYGAAVYDYDYATGVFSFREWKSLPNAAESVRIQLSEPLIELPGNALLIYGGIKWDDVKEDARAQRKALNDPNDPAHDPLMKAVLDALKPPEPAP